VSTSNVCDRSWFGERPPPRRPEAGRQEREKTTTAVRNALDALEVLVGQADGLSRYLSAHWDLTRRGPDLADALAVSVLVTQATACLGEVNIALAAARLRAGGAFKEGGGG
jgi:hypothetical protein